MTVRLLTTTGEHKILECIKVEVDPVTNTDMTVKNGVMLIKEHQE